MSALPASGLPQGVSEGWEGAQSCSQGVFVSLQNGEASLFEVNIRYIGGLLSTYYLTGEEVCAQGLL